MKFLLEVGDSVYLGFQIVMLGLFIWIGVMTLSGHGIVSFLLGLAFIAFGVLGILSKLVEVMTPRK